MRAIDEQNGIIETYSKNDKGQIQVFQEQDVEPFIEANKREMSSGNRGFSGDMHKMASIPPIVHVQWIEEMKAHGYPNPDPFAKENKKFLLAKLNSPDWNFLRTKQGVIG
jgi:hypothetical protein